jgi:hypothetical protein
MSLTVHSMIVRDYVHMLRNMLGWLDRPRPMLTARVLTVPTTLTCASHQICCRFRARC